MTMKRKIVSLAGILALALVAGQNLFAQTDTQDLEDEITQVNQAGQVDLTALLTRLSIQYNVELTVLLDLSAQGYEPGQLWLALEIRSASDKTLADALALVGETEGHGWGVLAQALGIKPGSAEFFALKNKPGEHNDNVVAAMNHEREKNGQENAKRENEDGGNRVEGKRADKGEGKGNRS